MRAQKVRENFFGYVLGDRRTALATDSEGMTEIAFGILVGPPTTAVALAHRAIAKGEDVDRLRALGRPIALEDDRRYGRLCPHRKKKNQKKKIF